MAKIPLVERLRRLHPDADEYIQRAVPWLSRVPKIVLGVGVLWLILVAILWIGASFAVAALELDGILHYLVGGLGVLLLLAYVVVGALVWAIAKRLRAEIGERNDARVG